MRFREKWLAQGYATGGSRAAGLKEAGARSRWMVKVSVDPLLGIDRPCKGPGGLLGHAPFPTPDLSALT